MLPLTTLSSGPPLLQAMTGRPDAMASSGTMPKCSFWGVYSTAVQAASSSDRCLWGWEGGTKPSRRQGNGAAFGKGSAPRFTSLRDRITQGDHAHTQAADMMLWPEEGHLPSQPAGEEDVHSSHTTHRSVKEGRTATLSCRPSPSTPPPTHLSVKEGRKATLSCRPSSCTSALSSSKCSLRRGQGGGEGSR